MDAALGSRSWALSLLEIAWLRPAPAPPRGSMVGPLLTKGSQTCVPFPIAPDDQHLHHHLMAYMVNGSWEGWKGDTVVELTDGSVWKQAEYHYEYRYAYRPQAEVSNDQMMVEGMSRAVQVRRLR